MKKFLLVCVLLILFSPCVIGAPTDFDAYILAQDKVYRLPGDTTQNPQYLFQLKGDYTQGEGLVVDGSHKVYLYATRTDDWNKPNMVDVYIRYPERGTDNWGASFSPTWGWKGANPVGYIGFAWYSHTGVSVNVTKSPSEPNLTKTESSQSCYWDTFSVQDEYNAGRLIPLKNPVTGADNTRISATETAVPTNPAYFNRSVLIPAGGHASDTGSFLDAPANGSHDTTWQLQDLRWGGAWQDLSHHDNGGDWWRIPNGSFYHSGFRQIIGAGSPSGWGGTVDNAWRSRGFMTIYEELWKKDHNIRRFSFDDSLNSTTASNMTVPVFSGTLQDEGAVCTYSDTMTIMGTLTGCQNGCGIGSLSQMLKPTNQIVKTIFTRDGKGILMQREDLETVKTCILKINNQQFNKTSFKPFSDMTGHTLCGDINMDSSARYIGVSAKKMTFQQGNDLEFVYLLNDSIVTDWLVSAGLQASNLQISMATVSDMYYLKGAMIYAYDDAKKTVYQFTRDETENFSTNANDPIWLRKGKTNDAISYLIARDSDIVDAIASDGIGNFYWVKDARFPDTDLDLDGFWRNDADDKLGGPANDSLSSQGSLFGINPFHIYTYTNVIGEQILNGDYLDKNAIGHFEIEDESVPKMWKVRFRYSQKQTKTCWRRDYYSGVTSSAGSISAGQNIWYQDIFVSETENIITTANKSSFTRKQIAELIKLSPEKWTFGRLHLESASDTLNKVLLAVINVAKAPEVYGYSAKLDIEKPFVVSGKHTVPASNDFEKRLPENKVYQFRIENSPSFDGFGINTRSREEYLLDLNRNGYKGCFPSTISQDANGSKDVRYFWRIMRIEEDFDADRKRIGYRRVRVLDKLNTTSTSISSLLTAGKYEIWCAAKYRFYDYTKMRPDATIEQCGEVLSGWLTGVNSVTYGNEKPQLAGVSHVGFVPGSNSTNLTLPLGVEDNHKWGGKQMWVSRKIVENVNGNVQTFQGNPMDLPIPNPSSEDSQYTFLWSVRTVEIDKQSEMTFDEGGPGVITCKKNAALNPTVDSTLLVDPEEEKLNRKFTYYYTDKNGVNYQLNTPDINNSQSAYINVIKVMQGITYEFNIQEIMGSSGSVPICMPFNADKASGTMRPPYLTWTPSSIIPADDDLDDSILFDRVNANVTGYPQNVKQAWYYDRTISMFMDDVITPNSGSWVDNSNNRWTSPYYIPPRYTQQKVYYGLLANGDLKVAPFSWVLSKANGLNANDPMIIPDVFASNGKRMPSVRWDDKWNIETGLPNSEYGANVKWTWELEMKMTPNHPNYASVHVNERNESVDCGEIVFPALKIKDASLKKNFQYCSSPGIYKLTCTMNRSFTYKTYDNVAYAYNPALGTTDEYLSEVDINNKIQISAYTYVFVAPNLKLTGQKPRIVFADSPVEYIVNAGQKGAEYDSVSSVDLLDTYDKTVSSPDKIRVVVEDPVGPFSSGVFEPAIKLSDLFSAGGGTDPGWADKCIGISNYQVQLNHDSTNFVGQYLGVNGFPGFVAYPGGSSTAHPSFTSYVNSYVLHSNSPSLSVADIGGTGITARGIIPEEVTLLRGTTYNNDDQKIVSDRFTPIKTSSYVMFALDPKKIGHFSVGLENTQTTQGGTTVDMNPYGVSAADVTDTIPYDKGTYMDIESDVSGIVKGDGFSFSLGLVAGGHDPAEYFDSTTNSYQFEHQPASVANFSMKLKVTDTLLPNVIVVLQETESGREIVIPKNLSENYQNVYKKDGSGIPVPVNLSTTDSCRVMLSKIEIGAVAPKFTTTALVTVPLYKMNGSFSGTDVYTSLITNSVNTTDSGSWGFPYYHSGLTHNVNDSDRFSTFMTGDSKDVQNGATEDNSDTIIFPSVNDTEGSLFEDNRYIVKIYAFDNINKSIPGTIDFSNYNYIIPETGTIESKKLSSLVYCRIYLEDEGPGRPLWEFPSNEHINSTVPAVTTWPIPNGTFGSGGVPLNNSFVVRRHGNLIIEGHVKTLSCHPSAQDGETDKLLGGNWDTGNNPQRTRYFKFVVPCYDTKVKVNALER